MGSPIIMRPMAFLMSGGDVGFLPAEACPVTRGPHHGPGDHEGFMVADAETADGSASVRVALWRCEPCGALLVGLGEVGPPLDGPAGTGVHAQEFTWFEESEGTA